MKNSLTDLAQADAQNRSYTNEDQTLNEYIDMWMAAVAGLLLWLAKAEEIQKQNPETFAKNS